MKRPGLYPYVPAILSAIPYEGHVCCPPWLPDHTNYIHKKVTKCWPNLNRDRCSLAYFECLSCSHSICIFFVPDVQRDAFCFTFRATRSQTLYVLNKSTVTQVSSRLVTCAECRHTAAPFVCPTIPNIKSNVGRNDSHHIVAFCNFRWPL